MAGALGSQGKVAQISVIARPPFSWVMDRFYTSCNYHTAPVIKTDGQFFVIDPAWFPEGPLRALRWVQEVGGEPFIHSVAPGGSPTHFLRSSVVK